LVPAIFASQNQEAPMNLFPACFALLCCWYAWRRQPCQAFVLVSCCLLTIAAPFLSQGGKPILLLPLLLIAWLRLDPFSLEQRANQIKLAVLALAVFACATKQLDFPSWALLPLLPFHVAWRGPFQAVRPAESLLLTTCLASLLLSWSQQNPLQVPLWGTISAAYFATLALAQKDQRALLLYQVLALSALTWALPQALRQNHHWFLLPLALEHLCWAAANPGHVPSSKLSCLAGTNRRVATLFSTCAVLAFSPLSQVLLPLSHPLPITAGLVHMVLALAPLKLLLPGLPLPKPFHANPLQACPPPANP
jgi:hypothetical protein